MKTAILFIAFAACGGGTPSKPTTPINTDPVPMKDPKTSTKTDSSPSSPTPEAPPASVKADLYAAERVAFEKAKPVFEANCARCHTKDGKMTAAKKREHFDMTTYPFGGHHAAEIGKQIRKSLGIDGSKPTMPFDKKGSVQGDDLKLIAAWADAFDAAAAAGVHDDAGHDDHDHDH